MMKIGLVLLAPVLLATLLYVVKTLALQPSPNQICLMKVPGLN